MPFVYLAIFALIGAFARYGQSILVQNLMGRAVCRRFGGAVDRGADLRRIPVTQPQNLRMKIVNRAFEADVR